jgi:glutathione S-transferase
MEASGSQEGAFNVNQQTGKVQRVLWGARTARTLRAHWMLHELGLEYEPRPIGSRTGETQTAEFSKLNPRQKIPVLQDGDITVAESAAIITYLAESYGQAAGLIPPPGSAQRAAYYEWCFFTMTELDAHTLYVIRKHTQLASTYGEAPNAVAAAREGFLKQASVAEQTLQTTGPYILGNVFTGADILLATCLRWAGRLELPLTMTLQSYLDSVTSRPAYRLGYEADQKF